MYLPIMVIGEITMKISAMSCLVSPFRIIIKTHSHLATVGRCSSSELLSTLAAVLFSLCKRRESAHVAGRMCMEAIDGQSHSRMSRLYEETGNT